MSSNRVPLFFQPGRIFAHFHESTNLLFRMLILTRVFSSCSRQVEAILRENPHIYSSPRDFFPLRPFSSFLTSLSFSSLKLKPLGGTFLFPRYFFNSIRGSSSWGASNSSFNIFTRSISMVSKPFVFEVFVVKSAQ